MIVEHFSDELQKELNTDCSLRDLKPIFDRISLPTPSRNHVILSREGGYNLFLNDYGSVLKIYPSLRQSVNEDQKSVTSSHLYHPFSTTPIGLVRFPKIAVQLMPGRQLSTPSDAKVSMLYLLMHADGHDADCGTYNWGFNFEKRLTLIDTVEAVQIEHYGHYDMSKINVLLRNSEEFDDLQKEFSASWSQPECFPSFWKSMKNAVSCGRLVTGWNDNLYHREKLDNPPDMNAISKSARAYSKLLNKCSL